MNKTESARCVRCNKEFVERHKVSFKEANSGLPESVVATDRFIDAVNLMMINIFSTCVICTEKLLPDNDEDDD